MQDRTRASADGAARHIGTAGAIDAMLPDVYDELRRLADHYLRDESNARTLQPTALVHEVYMRLVGENGRAWQSRDQLIAVASRAMRYLLIDHARRRRAAKRAGDRGRHALDEIAEPCVDRDEYLLALDEAMSDLAALDEQLVRVVELRFFGGLSVVETARVLDVSPTTVKRMWKLSKGWLHREIERES